ASFEPAWWRRWTPPRSRSPGPEPEAPEPQARRRATSISVPGGASRLTKKAFVRTKRRKLDRLRTIDLLRSGGYPRKPTGPIFRGESPDSSERSCAKSKATDVKQQTKTLLVWLGLIVAVLFLANLFNNSQKAEPLTYSEFRKQVVNQELSADKTSTSV